MMLLILHCKTMYKNRKDSPSTSTTSGTRSELIPIIRNGLIPGERGRQAVFFTAVSPMDDGYGMGNSTRSDETKDRAIQEYLESPSKDGILMQFDARSRERFAILPNAVTGSRSQQHTTCSLHWESGMYEKHRRLTQRIPRVVLKSNSQYGQQDPQSPDARLSREPSSDSKSNGETANNSRIQHARTMSRSGSRSSFLQD